MKRLLAPLALCAAVALGGCTAVPNLPTSLPNINPLAPIGQLTAGDLSNAAAEANMPNNPPAPMNPNAIDPAAYQCFGTMGPIIDRMSAGQNVGLFSQVEALRVIIIASRQNGSCALIAAPILAQLSTLPGAGNAIAIAATTVQTGTPSAPNTSVAARANASLNGN